MVRHHESGEKRLVVLGHAIGFQGQPNSAGTGLICPLTPVNCDTLRRRLDWLCPQPLGLQTSAGFGDRLGSATPGHIAAMRLVERQQVGDLPAPVFAQQSVRENERTGRSPLAVLDDATWGVFQAGWHGAWGADADHLKTPEAAAPFIEAGYTFFTVDPGDHVDNGAHSASLDDLRQAFLSLPWNELEDGPESLRDRYLDEAFPVEGFTITFDEESLLRAACKYGRALAHAARMFRYVRREVDERTYVASDEDEAEAAFELEVSVDETETRTSPAEHYFIASELRRLGVRWVSLAPRYVGRFEKGVDYIGDLDEFEKEIEQHAAIARVLGPYKLSIHSGSDKFSIYPLIARHTRGLVHLKTAGTSYLEALRAIAGVAPDLFREVFARARERYEEDRATYHVSGELERVPAPSEVADIGLVSLLDQFDSRQVLHVTFGSILAQFGPRLEAVLDANEEAHYSALEAHFSRHLEPFVRG